jgi:hypothetical protein
MLMDWCAGAFDFSFRFPYPLLVDPSAAIPTGLTPQLRQKNEVQHAFVPR